MDVMVVVDMQVGLLNDEPKYDLQGVVGRINLLNAMMRQRSGKVVWVRHCGKAGDPFEPQLAGWAFLPELVRQDNDIVIEKTLNDPFVGTPLKETLEQLAPGRVFVTGWATDFCVDATVRSAISKGHHVVVVADGHTLSNRPHLKAPIIIQHHSWVWSRLLTNRCIRVAAAARLLDEDAQQA